MNSSEDQPVKRDDLVQVVRDAHRIVAEAGVPERFEPIAFELVLNELLEYESE